MSDSPQICPTSTPRLPRHVKFRFDKTRDAWVILGPERVLFPDGVAVEILKRCDGEANVESIAGDLAQGFDTTVEAVQDDVIEFLRDMAERGFIEG